MYKSFIEDYFFVDNFTKYACKRPPVKIAYAFGVNFFTNIPAISVMQITEIESTKYCTKNMAPSGFINLLDNLVSIVSKGS